MRQGGMRNAFRGYTVERPRYQPPRTSFRKLLDGRQAPLLPLPGKTRASLRSAVAVLSARFTEFTASSLIRNRPATAARWSVTRWTRPPSPSAPRFARTRASARSQSRHLERNSSWWSGTRQPQKPHRVAGLAGIAIKRPSTGRPSSRSVRSRSGWRSPDRARTRDCVQGGDKLGHWSAVMLAVRAE